MKRKNQIMKDMKTTLADLQTGCTDSNPAVHIWLLHKLEVLADILGEDVPLVDRIQIEEILDRR